MQAVGAHRVGGDVVGRALQAAQEVVLDQLEKLDQAPVYIDGHVDGAQAHALLRALVPLEHHQLAWVHLNRP